MSCIVSFINSLIFFFFKQKTAYEMRISDWSSDVCSSDLWIPHGKQIPDGTEVVLADGAVHHCHWSVLTAPDMESGAGVPEGDDRRQAHGYSDYGAACSPRR